MNDQSMCKHLVYLIWNLSGQKKFLKLNLKKQASNWKEIRKNTLSIMQINFLGNINNGVRVPVLFPLQLLHELQDLFQIDEFQN